MGEGEETRRRKGGCIYNINNWRSKIFVLWKRRNTEKEKEENIWRRIMLLLEEKKKGERKKRKMFGR